MVKWNENWDGDFPRLKVSPWDLWNMAAQERGNKTKRLSVLAAGQACLNEKLKQC